MESKVIKQLEEEIEYLRSENELLWNFLEELKQADFQRMQEAERKFIEDLFNRSTYVGDA
jgi:nicotinic acid phosphoribosyltransferase